MSPSLYLPLMLGLTKFIMSSGFLDIFYAWKRQREKSCDKQTKDKSSVSFVVVFEIQTDLYSSNQSISLDIWRTLKWRKAMSDKIAPLVRSTVKLSTMAKTDKLLFLQVVLMSKLHHKDFYLKKNLGFQSRPLGGAFCVNHSLGTTGKFC